MGHYTSWTHGNISSMILTVKSAKIIAQLSVTKPVLKMLKTKSKYAWAICTVDHR